MDRRQGMPSLKMSSGNDTNMSALQVAHHKHLRGGVVVVDAIPKR